MTTKPGSTELLALAEEIKRELSFAIFSTERQSLLERAENAIRLAAEPSEEARETLRAKMETCALYNFDSVEMVECKHTLWQEMLALFATKPAADDVTLMRERCAKIAEPWPGFWLDENSTDVDRAVVAVRTEIAKKILALSTTQAPKP